MMDNLRTIEAQTVQKLTNNEVWPKFTGSYKKKGIVTWLLVLCKYNFVIFIFWLMYCFLADKGSG